MNFNANLNSVSLIGLLKHEDVFLRSHLLQDLGPHRDADFSQVRFAQQEHQGTGLPNASANREGELVLDDSLMVRKFEVVEKV